VRAMASMSNNTNNTARGDFVRRGVVILFITLIAYLGVRWSQTALPENGQDVGDHPILSMDVAAVISLNRPANEVVLPQILDAFSISGDHRTIVVYNSGNIATIPDSQRESVVTEASRAHGWFLPNMIGTVSISTDSRQATIPLFRSQKGLFTPLASKNKTITTLWNKDAMSGIRAKCPDECDELPHDLSTFSQSDLEFDLFTYSSDIINMSFDTATKKETIVKVLSNIVARQSPETQQRTLPDGTIYRALVPNSNVNVSDGSIGDGTITTIQAGDKKWTILQHAGSFFSTNDNKTQSALLSTQLLTNKVCGKKPIWFYQLIDSEAWPNPIFVTQSRNRVTVCVK